jgi:cephalosporin-C deacetylase-like acetyl esterase
VFGVLLYIPVVSGQAVQQDPFLDWMNTIAQQDLQRRAQTIRSIRSVEDAERRQQYVRQELLNDLGGLPDYHGPLNARVTGELHAGSYTIEKVLYQSLPGFYVTANLYLPNQPGRYPAVLLQAGHTQEGKPEDQRIAANLAMKGFVVLCFDPIGQGERVQTYSRQLDAPLAGWSVPEHIELDAQTQLLGQGLARYFIWDAMRSLDYLASRPEVDASRIGAAGCSGGGALTTFIGALDPRVKAVVPACYPSSFKTLFATSGPHGEMTFPNFLASGLDTADFVELSAPKPWLLQSTQHDKFGFSREGVQLVYNEAQDFYSLYHARDKVGFMVSPGDHGMPLEAREGLYQWMIRWLKNGQGDFHEQPVKMFSDGELRVTRTGHVEDEPGSRKLFQILADELRAKRSEGTISTLRAELKSLAIPTDASAPKVRILDETSDDFGKRQHLQLESEPEIWLDATLYLPSSAGRKPAVLIVGAKESSENPSTATTAEKIARLGQVVLELNPRASVLQNTSGSYTGDWISAMQANLIGRNLPAMRAHDILRGVDLLRTLPDVDPDSIRATARGVTGICLLLAAAADFRIKAIWLDKTPYSLRSAFDNSMTADLSEVVIPGFVLHWDLDDLVKAMGTRPVLWTDPTNWMQGVVPLRPPYRYRYVLGDVTDETDTQDDRLIREFLH